MSRQALARPGHGVRVSPGMRRRCGTAQVGRGTCSGSAPLGHPLPANNRRDRGGPRWVLRGTYILWRFHCQGSWKAFSSRRCVTYLMVTRAERSTDYVVENRSNRMPGTTQELEYQVAASGCDALHPTENSGSLNRRTSHGRAPADGMATCVIISD